MNRHRLLFLAESLSLIASVAGSVGAAVSGQILYATAPLSLSIVLNLVNRSQFEQRKQQRMTVAITEAYQQLSQEIQSLRTSIESASANPTTSQELNRKFDSVHEEIAQIRNQCTNLHESLQGLVYRMLSYGSLSSADPKPAEKGIAKIIWQYQQEKKERRKLYEISCEDELIPDQETDF